MWKNVAAALKDAKYVGVPALARTPEPRAGKAYRAPGGPATPSHTCEPLPRTAAYEILSEPRVRCSFDKCRYVSQEAIRSFYAEAAHALNSVDPRTPIIVGPAPFYHVDGLPALMPAPADLGDRLIYAFNWFAPRKFVNGELKISYPGLIGCCDAHEREPDSSCPQGCDQQVPLDAALLENLLSQPIAFSDAHR